VSRTPGSAFFFARGFRVALFGFAVEALSVVAGGMAASVPTATR
jgi:hypothetical protein